MWDLIAPIIAQIISILFILFMNPYAIVAIFIAILLAIFAVIFFGVEAVNLGKKLVLKTFYCPFRKMMVEALLRPSIFTFRKYDDVIRCSAFKGKVTCKKKCLDLPLLQT